MCPQHHGNSNWFSLKWCRWFRPSSLLKIALKGSWTFHLPCPHFQTSSYFSKLRFLLSWQTPTAPVISSNFHTLHGIRRTSWDASLSPEDFKELIVFHLLFSDATPNSLLHTVPGNLKLSPYSHKISNFGKL